VSFINEHAPLVLRIFLVVLFPFSALDKVVNWPAAMRQCAGIPWPRAMLIASIIVELGAPLCIVTGWHDRVAACVLAGFCVITAVLFHQFWKFGNFWHFKEGEGLQHFWDFLKNFGLVGGLGLIVFSPQTLSATQASQFAFTHVTAPGAGDSRPDR
jgi:putative oxidoreductase